MEYASGTLIYISIHALELIPARRDEVADMGEVVDGAVPLEFLARVCFDISALR